MELKDLENDDGDTFIEYTNEEIPTNDNNNANFDRMFVPLTL